ncbi:MAG TPA: hypothetical protein VIL00_06780 [Pseudonocardiaceae bacterium]
MSDQRPHPHGPDEDDVDAPVNLPQRGQVRRPGITPPTSTRPPASPPPPEKRDEDGPAEEAGSGLLRRLLRRD